MPVAARFHEIRDRVVNAVDQRFAEPVRLSFLRKGVADPERPAIEIDGVLRATKERQDGGSRTPLAAGGAELFINQALYSGPRLEVGDRLCALSRPGQPWFEILAIEDRGEARLVLQLGEV